MADETELSVDLSAGVPAASVSEGALLAGRVGEDEVILLRSGGSLFAVAATCTHYSGPLAEGLLVDGMLRCPWHHAGFDVRSGEAVRAPALDPIGCWRVEQIGETAYVREKIVAPSPGPRIIPIAAAEPESIVIVGGGAAGLAAAAQIRRLGYAGAVTMISADASPPCDRPNLSKDYLAGTASEDWIPLRPPEFYSDNRIDLLLDSRVDSIDLEKKRVRLEHGDSLDYGALLLATGAEPVRIEIPGASENQVHTLRSFADSRAIVAKAGSAKHAVVIGTSFIGLEAAAALRTRGLEVHVIGREGVPMQKVLGAEVGRTVQALHEARGVVFHFGTSVSRIEGDTAVLADGTRLAAELVVVGAGVRPATGLAERAGLSIDRGVTVDAFLQTSAPNVYAAGDIARWPDPHSGERLRVEHWVIAQRQGQVAAMNMLGRPQRFDAVPFFWSQHYDVGINYVGHAESWDSIEIDGSLEQHDCRIRYRRGGRTLAVATISRDGQSLRAEREMELEGVAA